MAVTAQDIVNQAETYLAQTSQMDVAGLPSGTGESDIYTITSNQQLLNWINEGQNRVARLCLPIADTATFTPATAGQSTIGPYSAVTSSAGRTLHTPTELSIGTKDISPANQGQVTNKTWYPSTPDGDPTGWANNNSAIGLSPYTTRPAFTIGGYFLPTPVVLLTTPIDTFLDDFAQRAVAFYVAWMVAAKNRDNSVLSTREVPCANEWIGSVREIYSRIIANDETLAGIFPPAPIDAMVQLVKQMTPRT